MDTFSIYKKYMIEIINGDFFEEIKKIETGSIDLVLTDPPFGMTNFDWDKELPLEDFIVYNNKQMNKQEFLCYAYKNNLKYEEALDIFNNNKKHGMWYELKRVIHDKSTIALFGSEAFASKLINSNKNNFKYNWIWKKNRATNFLNAKRQPLRNIEFISIFYGGKYFPQKTTGHKPVNSYTKKNDSSMFNKTKENFSGGGNTDRYPTQFLEFNVIKNDNSDKNKYHQTQKPLDLLEYLIKTYTNENDLVLDFTAGSFSTAVACAKLNRRFIGIEIDPKNCEIAKERLKLLK